ncbi:MAG: hypothetical protein ACMVO3_22670 [Thalassobaculum sp.]
MALAGRTDFVVKTTPGASSGKSGPPMTPAGELDRKAVNDKVGNAMKALSDIAAREKAARKG